MRHSGLFPNDDSLLVAAMIVTIDGPAGTGKSTVARKLADRLGFSFLDTGAMYRAVAARCLAAGIDPEDRERVAELAKNVKLHAGVDRTIVDGHDVTGELRTAPTTEAASRIAQNVDVRAALVGQQQLWAAGKNVVSEGRDQGTVAFPEANCKFFLTAHPEERARRRQQELAAKGEDVSLQDLLADQTARDQRDQSRTIAPLRPAEDAMLVDTTDLPIEAVLDQLEHHVRQSMTIS